MSSTSLISDAREDELAALARLMAAAPLLIRYRATFDSALAALSDGYRGGDALLVARVGPVAPVVGLAWVSVAPRTLNGAAYLHLLLVADGAQGRGLGSQLLEASERVARERANHLYLLATTDNTRARVFYEQHGYRHVGDLPGLVWPDLDEALYHKPLRGQGERLSA
jgi:GNAT superfamily N-acetyltransferase